MCLISRRGTAVPREMTADPQTVASLLLVGALSCFVPGMSVATFPSDKRTYIHRRIGDRNGWIGGGFDPYHKGIRYRYPQLSSTDVGMSPWS